MNLAAFPHLVRTSQPHYTSLRFGGISALCMLAILFCASAVSWARDIDWASLNLTQQQESHIHRLENNWEKTHAEVGAQIERDRAEMKALLPTGDTQRIRVLQNRIMTNKMYLMNESMNTFLQKRDMLTPTQRAQLQKILPHHQNNTSGAEHE